MSKTTRMQKCPHCGGGIVRTKKEQACTVDGTRFVARVAAFSCRKCRAIFLPGPALARLDLEVACTLAARAGPSGERLRFLRKVLGLRGLELAALFQVTPETVSRWERGQRDVDFIAWIAAGSLVLEKAGRKPCTRERLTSLAQAPKLPKTIHVDVGREPAKVSIKVTRGSTSRRADSERGPITLGRSTSSGRVAVASER